MATLNESLRKWSSEDGGNELISINKLLTYLGENLFHDYEPSSSSFPEYYSRLNKWVFNLAEESDQQNLLRLAQEIFYVGREEFGSLYRTAYNNIVTRWVIDNSTLDLLASSFNEELLTEMKQVWFCPVTDSMRINQFYHINHVVSSHEFRPDWRSLKKFGDTSKIKQYIQANNIKYIVLLEDFVGSATQSYKPVKFACQLDPNIKVLFIPLIICKKGAIKLQSGLNEFDNFSLSPVLTVDESCFITKYYQENEDTRNTEFRELIEKAEPSYKEHKFGFEDMGCLLVMYTNTPNNSLPIIYHESQPSWTPLFNRHHRSKQ